MSEREPQYGFFFEINGEQHEATAENTFIILHESDGDSKYDYIASVYEDEDGDDCLYVNWRGDLPKDVEEFDVTVHDMQQAGFTPATAPKVTDSVREWYDQAHPPVESYYTELTPRQELRPRFLNYLLHHNLLTPDDFQIEGDLYL
jgi:hypothetical protein